MSRPTRARLQFAMCTRPRPDSGAGRPTGPECHIHIHIDGHGPRGLCRSQNLTHLSFLRLPQLQSNRNVAQAKCSSMNR